ncbi:class III poly(R)-hydroxyalkanoic acid synthase subunit PhaE [Marichromatium bheemlicum]|uniref:Poly(3-hydroxyalkanoate) polymerase subunit PhaE n=1 Tax=Marichromatium bheemlicum TaxID=365339 RepID=A0ABX1I8L8_9GAMM|nr:class III poly(R)-hydroxyalkanoic acid synthase subunit PhaE [Marichromatium bheemlicum]NKN33907.1 class III poly(R)-hydroxyalkanoic acid synthase subunit PhaE [Marichromatium bheemlicum]
MSKGIFFNDDWLELQRKYWDDWTEMSRKAMGMPEHDKPTNAWSEAMEQWWRALSPAAPDSGRAFMDKLIEQGRTLFGMGEQFVNGGPDPKDPVGAWFKAVEEMQRRFTGSGESDNEALKRMTAFWELPLDNWQRMMSSLSPVPGDFLRNMPHDQLKDRLDQALSAPGLGYTREEQAQYQDLLRGSMEYQAALQEYTGFYSRLGMKSVERMASFLQGVVDSGKTIDSARALYDNWVSCCESVYAEEVATPEYARLHGRLINAQMRLKKRMSVIVDENLGALNMPTRSELRTLQDRLQETRRENKQLRCRLYQLEKRVEAAHGTAAKEPATALKRAPTTRKTTTRKKTTAKSTPSDS